jgi:hypothetical protein
MVLQQETIALVEPIGVRVRNGDADAGILLEQADGGVPVAVLDAQETEGNLAVGPETELDAAVGAVPLATRDNRLDHLQRLLLHDGMKGVQRAVAAGVARHHTIVGNLEEGVLARRDADRVVDIVLHHVRRGVEVQRRIAGQSCL